MKVRTAHAITSFALLAVLTGTLISASCAAGPNTPTAPSSGTASPALSITSSVSGQQSFSSANAQHTLLLTKTCDAIDHCTVITAPSGPIPVESDVNYFGPLLEAQNGQHDRRDDAGR